MRSAHSFSLIFARSAQQSACLLTLFTLTSSLAQAQVPEQPPAAVVAPAPAPSAPPPAAYVQPTAQPAPIAPSPAQPVPAAPQYAPPQYASPQPAPAPQYAPAAPQYAPAVYPAAQPATGVAQPYPIAPGYPPPPPGYTYAPLPPAVLTPADIARRDMVHAELMRVEAHLAQVDAKRQDIGGPIAQTAVGLGSTLVLSVIALSAFGAAEAIQHRDYRHCDRYGNDYNHCYDDLDVNDSGVVNEKDELTLRRTAYATTGLAAVALAVGITGVVRLARRNTERRAVKAERKGLIEQRNNLRQQLDYGVNVAPGQLQMGVQGKF